MNAKEARERSTKNLANVIDRELAPIYKRIESAVDEGEFFIDFSGAGIWSKYDIGLSMESVKRLESEGYKFDQMGGGDMREPSPSWVRLSW